MNVRLRYFAVLRDQRGLEEESVETEARTPSQLYAQLSERHRFRLPSQMVRAAVNGAFVDESYELQDGDEVVFIPPVAGG